MESGTQCAGVYALNEDARWSHEAYHYLSVEDVLEGGGLDLAEKCHLQSDAPLSDENRLKSWPLSVLDESFDDELVGGFGRHCRTFSIVAKVGGGV